MAKAISFVAVPSLRIGVDLTIFFFFKTGELDFAPVQWPLEHGRISSSGIGLARCGGKLVGADNFAVRQVCLSFFDVLRV